MIKPFFICVISLFFIGCGGSANNANDPFALTQPMAVYNQAYQENYVADSITDIVVNANHAYVLLDTFAAGISSHIANIKAHGNEVGGYISAGTGEDWRDDFLALKPFLTPTVWPQWPGEFFVSETTTGILPLMKARIDKMADAGVDWVEFDNMDWLDEETRNTYSLQATEAEAKAYINALCDYTQAKGMKCMAKNTVDGFSTFDGVLYESYDVEKNWWDSAGTIQFLAAKKPVIINHYNEANCDQVYAEYKRIYNSEKISFICEDVSLGKYKHYNQL